MLHTISEWRPTRHAAIVRIRNSGVAFNIRLRRFQAVIATGVLRSLSIGFLNSSRLRGRSLSPWATHSRSSEL